MGRSRRQEILDLGPPHYTLDEYRDCLQQLGKIGTRLGGDRISLQAIRAAVKEPTSFLDVGCGGGHFARVLGRTYPKAHIVGIDLNREAILFAMRQPAANVAFEHRQNPDLSDASKSFDVVTSTLTCHHMSDAEIVEFLKRACIVSRKAIVINDLHRSWLAFFAFAVVAPLLFPNRLILHDGLLSIRRSFKRRDWIRYLKEAGIETSRYKLNWRWPFRWVVSINQSSLAEE